MLIYASVVIGIIISVVLPLLRGLLPKPPSAIAGNNWWKPYLYTGLFSLITALLVVAAVGSQLDSWSTALLAGYMWDSTIQKATTGNVSVG
jgi:hypothetical protein